MRLIFLGVIYAAAWETICKRVVLNRRKLINCNCIRQTADTSITKHLCKFQSTLSIKCWRYPFASMSRLKYWLRATPQIITRLLYINSTHPSCNYISNAHLQLEGVNQQLDLLQQLQLEVKTIRLCSLPTASIDTDSSSRKSASLNRL